MSRAINRFKIAVESTSEWSGKLVMFLIIPMFLVPFAESIIMRTLLNQPTIWGLETTTFIFGFYFVIGGAYCLIHKGHVSMDLLRNRLGTRGRGYFDVFSYLCILVFCAVLTWFGGKWAWESTMMMERTSTAWMPYVWPVRWAVPIGAVLLTLQALSEFISSIEAILGRQEE